MHAYEFAMRVDNSRGLDLVEVSPNQDSIAAAASYVPGITYDHAFAAAASL